MKYVEFIFSTVPEDTSEILIALLSELGFDTFDQSDENLVAYIQESDLTETVEAELQAMQQQFHFSFTRKEMEQKNWNEEWEKNFQPLVIDDKCLIRAPFHDNTDEYPYDIIIEPRMSFGTGHHPTTLLMLRALMEMDLTEKHVCDAGSGTGVLAIMSVLLGARYVYAIDNNEWAFNNALDNMALNNMVDQIEVEMGELDMLTNKQFDLLLANINRSILIQYMSVFKKCLENNGKLLLSGILTPDMPMILDAANKQGFRMVRNWEEEEWSCALFE
jgi:ribosomal protein L11 methyltransferase